MIDDAGGTDTATPDRRTPIAPGDRSDPAVRKEREAEIAEICGQLNALHARLVALIGDALADGHWAGWGLRSPAHWVAWQTGLSPRRAGELVRMATRAPELPETMTAFADGELAVDQVAAIAKHTPPWADHDMAVLARQASVSQIRVASRAFAPEAVPPVDDPTKDRGPADEPLPDRCWFGVGEDGQFSLQAKGGPDGGLVIEAALREARDRLFHAGHPSAEINWWDALVEVAQRALGPDSSDDRPDRFRVYLHLDGETGAVRSTTGPTLPAWARDLLTCDTSLIPVWERDGVPVSVGRARRTAPDHLRRLVLHRDGGCRFPGCTNTLGLHTHHIVYWTRQGETSTSNLVALCGTHHRMQHRGEIQISGDADGEVEFRNRHGTLIRGVVAPTPPTGPAPPAAKPYVHPSGERLVTKWLDFEQPEPPGPPDTS